MKGSIKLFTWFGIPVFLHWSFGLLVLYAFWSVYSDHFEWMVMAWLASFIAALFTCVLLHEYGHALMARRFGVRTQDIVLTPIGGIARLERMPEKPVQEFLVAIAGPMVNVVIALLLFGVGAALFRGDDWDLFTWVLGEMFGGGEEMEGSMGSLFFVAWLLAANVTLVLFNLIPAFPMDGGRIFRSLLAMALGRVRATRVAAWLGQGIAVIFIGIGLFTSQFMLALIGIFVFMMARSENAMVQLEARMKQYRAADLMRPAFTRLLASDWMQTPAAMLRQGLERHFLVFDLHERPVGVLEESQIVEAIRRHDLTAEVSDYMRGPVPVVRPDLPLRELYQLTRTQDLAIVAVADADGRILGVIDEVGLQNFLRLGV